MIRVRPVLGAGLFLLALLLAVAPATAQPADEAFRAGRFDNGKMWTFDTPPIDYLRETYGFSPDAGWFDEARLAALRIPGCSASFVSPHGLVMTNHHCARSAVVAVTRDGEDLLTEGFYADALAEERRAPDMYADQLIAISDVTDEVVEALDAAETDAERAQIRQDVLAAITERLVNAAGGEAAGFHAEVVSLYNGGRYAGYTFRRYDDVRVVMAPELQMGYYGGDADNFTYPRYSLDFAFLRVYDDTGNPLETSTYFPWSDTGVEEGTLVFAIGNPGSTFRLETVAQLEYRRDVREPIVLDFLRNRARALQAALDENPNNAAVKAQRNSLFSMLNAQKLYEGRVTALNDAMIMARRADTERQLREALEADEALQAAYGDLIGRMAELQGERRALAQDFGAFFILTNTTFNSAALARALYAYRYLTEQQSEATEAPLDRLRQQILAVPQKPRAVDERQLAVQLQDFETFFGADDAIAQAALQGETPEAAARRLFDTSALADSARAADALMAGTLSLDDPLLQAVATFATRYADFQSANAGLGEQEQDLAGRLGRARYAVYGTAVPPDATFSIRLADGLVQGYEYNGTVAPPYTTFYGLYDHYHSYGPDSEWDLPEQWLDPPETFDLSTPINFVSTADITGGNSGSPIVNRDLEIVGLVFDGNIESLSGDYIYLPDRNRAVAVDARGMLEALDDIYDADRLVLELKGTAFVPTEAEADAVGSQ